MEKLFVYVFGLTLLSEVATYCWILPNIEMVPDGYSLLQYNKSEAIIQNPGRGFIEEFSISSHLFEPLNIFKLDVLHVTTGATLVLRHFLLNAYVQNIISDEFMMRLRKDLTTIRKAGFMVVLRFSYSKNLTDTVWNSLLQNKKDIYADASKQWIKVHINQLKHVLREFQAVILTVQTGFIGTWGEWLYTDHFGMWTLTNENMNDRREIVYELLEAVPPQIQIQLRTPSYKRSLFGEEPTTATDRCKDKAKARIGFHNDCFLADDTDKGMYQDFDTEYEYMKKDSKFVIVGGETCSPSQNKRHLCPTALKELEELHFTFLAQSYHKEVVDVWRSKGGCFYDIGQRLGYRLVVIQAILPDVVYTGQAMSYHLVVRNEGYATPAKQMDVSLILFSETNGAYKVLIDADTQTWLPGTDVVLSGSCRLPAGLPLYESYRFFIAISDKMLHDLSNYYVLLANENMPWQFEGINDLNHTVKIEKGIETERIGNNSCPTFSSWNLPVFTSRPRILGSPACLKTTIPNHNFEEGAMYWKPYGTDFEYRESSMEAFEGRGFVRVSDGAVFQLLNFPTNSTHVLKRLTIRARSKHSGHVNSTSSDYSIYCDVWPQVGAPRYGINTPFEGGISGVQWHSKILHITVQQGIADAYCYLRYDGIGKGYADFDLMEVWILTGDADFTDCVFED